MKPRRSDASPEPSLGGPQSLSLDERVARLERRLAPANQPPSAGEVSDEALAVIAARICQSRLRRGRHLPFEILGEPAWDIMLDLFVAAVRGKAVRTCSACYASGAPLTTALRWLAALETRGLVERHSEFGDHRVNLVRLSREGFKAMRAYLLAGLAAGELSAGS
jgi:hypothetical protein